MKVKNLIFSIVVFFVFAKAVFASDEKKPDTEMPLPEKAQTAQVSEPEDDLPPPPPFAFSKEDARLIKSLFLMSDSELRRLRGFIQHLEKTSPAQRKKMAADLDRATVDMTNEQRRIYVKEMRERFRKSQENLLARYYSTLSKEQANAERKKFLSLDHKGRRAYIFEVRKKLGYKPRPDSPENKGRKKPPPPAPEEENHQQ